MTAYSWTPAGECGCPDHVVRRLLRHTPWRDGEAFLCDCGAAWLCRQIEDPDDTAPPRAVDMDLATVDPRCPSCLRPANDHGRLALAVCRQTPPGGWSWPA